MIIVISLFSGIGATLIAVYLYLARQFSIHGDQQIDDLAANVAAWTVMFAVGLGLLIKYFLLDHATGDSNFRRILFSVITTYGLIGTATIVRAMSRHFVVEKDVHIGLQIWRYSTHNEHSTGDISGGKDGQHSTIYYHTIKPTPQSMVYVVIMWFSSACLVAFSAWLLYISIGKLAPPADFHMIYLTTFITLGIVYVLLSVAWFIWSWVSKPFRSCFSAHFDVFCLSHCIFLAVVVFMLIGYRYTYSSVPNDFFPDETTVPALKLAYWTKISILQLILFPLVAMGVAKGGCLMANEYPVDLERYAKYILQQRRTRKE
jgi:hypothetical protein